MDTSHAVETGRYFDQPYAEMSPDRQVQISNDLIREHQAKYQHRTPLSDPKFHAWNWSVEIKDKSGAVIEVQHFNRVAIVQALEG